MASHVLTELSGMSIEALPIKHGKKHFQSVYNKLTSNVPTKDIQIKFQDLDPLLHDVWNCRCCVTSSLTNVLLVRWRKDMPLTKWNLVPLCPEKARNHKLVDPKNLEQTYGKEIYNKIEKILENVKLKSIEQEKEEKK